MLMLQIRKAAVKYAELHRDNAVLATTSKLARQDEWCGGRAWVAA